MNVTYRNATIRLAPNGKGRLQATVILGGQEFDRGPFDDATVAMTACMEFVNDQSAQCVGCGQ